MPGGTRLAIASLLAVLAVALVGGSVRAAPLDATAATDDRSVSVPTGWWTYTNVTEQQVGDFLNANGARLTDVEVYSAAANTFTVTMVRNTGSYWVPGWWWYYDKSEAEVKSLLATNNARLIDVDPYLEGGNVRFAVVMVSNTGAFQRTTSWDAGVTSAQISSLVGNGSVWRLTDLESYWLGPVKLYAYLAVSNSGADAKSWEWWLNQTPASIGTKVNAFGGRITNLERQADGSYNFIQVKNAGSDNKYWRFYFGLPTLSYTNQVAGQYATRVLEVETYTVNGLRLYDSVMIDNANVETRRITNLFSPTFTSSNGLPIANFGAYVKRIGGGAGTNLQGGRKFEPASAIKAVHNLRVMRLVQAGPAFEQLSNSLTFYNYPNAPFNAGTKDACTIAADETAANQMSATVDWGKDQMMSISDNRTTRAFVLRYGLAALNSTAHNTAQMADTQIDQDEPGCGWKGGKKNETTLADLGRLYEGVEDGSLLSGGFRTEFYQPMNGGAFDDNFTEAAVVAIVSQEAAAQGKSAVVTSFVNGMSWRHKGGSYNIPCADAGCASGHLYFRSLAGRLTVPVKLDRAINATRTYVFGRYVDSLNINCAGCVSSASADAALTAVTPELFREVIASALETW